MNDSNGVKTLVEDIARALVDTPTGVVVNEISGEHATVFELRVAAPKGYQPAPEILLRAGGK